MQLYYFETKSGNFGDDLNLWLWDELLPGWRDWETDRILVGVGTLLSDAFQRRANEEKGSYLVVGSGAGYGTATFPDMLTSDRWDVRCVRGPRTAKHLGLPDELGIVDPAMMIGEHPDFQGIQPNGRAIFVPHVASDHRHDWKSACEAAGLDYVSPSGESKEVIQRIARAELVLAESMHAAILADAFRRPWIPVRIGWLFELGKWQDWASSLNIQLDRIDPLFPAIESSVSNFRRMFPRTKHQSEGQLGLVGTNPTTRERSGTSRSLRLRLSVERLVLTNALATAIKRPAYLSDVNVLNRRRAQLRQVLTEITRDYGGA